MALGFQRPGFQHLAWQQSDPVTPPPPPPSTGPTPAGAPGKGGKASAERRHLVEIDGKLHRVRNAEEARQILEIYKAQVEDELRAPEVKPAKTKRRAPKITASPSQEIQAVVHDFRRDISQLYRLYAAASEAIQAASLIRMAQELDDEEAIAALFRFH